MHLIFATHNNNKAKEIHALLGDNFKISTLYDIGITEEIPETGQTLEENAIQKAREVFKLTNLNCFADDTGLEVEVLNNAPGVYSARYAGQQKNSSDNINLLLSQMQNETNRNARFKTVICLILDGKEYLFEGILNGVITHTPSGSNGFGYDPIFMPEGFSKTLAEISLEEKNKISHRAKAFILLKNFIAQYKKL
ncbi:MAG: RdgB/HAM1 family non-canonical purine NTP pyrophosphatase [Bacteroidia bacterium]